jgi:hypothetical protein
MPPRLLPLFVTFIVVFAASAWTQAATFKEQNRMVVMEAENFTRNKGFTSVKRDDASGGAVMQAMAGGSAFALDFDITVETGGTWHFLVRHNCPDHESNGMFLYLDGKQVSAPAGHPYPGETDIYLKKSVGVPGLYPASPWYWTPEWQAPGDGKHQGPITLTLTPGKHVLTIVKRSIERPHLDKLLLSVADMSQVLAHADPGPGETCDQGCPATAVPPGVMDAGSPALHPDAQVNTRDVGAPGDGAADGTTTSPASPAPSRPSARDASAPTTSGSPSESTSPPSRTAGSSGCSLGRGQFSGSSGLALLAFGGALFVRRRR